VHHDHSDRHVTRLGDYGVYMTDRPVILTGD
jgi:hypothetical protein